MQSTYLQNLKEVHTDHHSVNNNRRNPWGNPQKDPFQNANSDEYFGEYKSTVASGRKKTIQEPGIAGIFSNLPSVSRYSTSSAEIEPPTLVPLSANWLKDVLNELEDFPAYAQDEGIEEPSSTAIAKVKKLLTAISSEVMERPDVYPVEVRSIAIDIRSFERMSSALFVIEEDGAGVLFHRTENSKGRLRVDDATDLLSEVGIGVLRRVGI